MFKKQKNDSFQFMRPVYEHNKFSAICAVILVLKLLFD